MKWSLRRSSIFKGMASFDESKLISLGTFVHKKDEEVIIDSGGLDDKVYICLEGKINDWNVGVIINENEALDELVESFVSPHQLVKKESGYIFYISLRLIQKEKSR